MKFIGQPGGAIANAWAAGNYVELGSCFTKDSVGTKDRDGFFDPIQVLEGFCCGAGLRDGGDGRERREGYLCESIG